MPCEILTLLTGFLGYWLLKLKQLLLYTPLKARGRTSSHNGLKAWMHLIFMQKVMPQC